MEELIFDNGEGTFIVSHRKRRSHHMPSDHFHNTYEIYYLMSGSRTFFIKDRTLVANEGDVVVVSPNVLHRTTNAEFPEHERLVVNIHESCMTPARGFSADLLQPLFEKEYVIVRCSRHDRSTVDSLADRILQEIRERKPGFDTYALTLVQQLLIVCCRRIGTDDGEPEEQPSPMHERISDIVRYINAHYMEELSLRRLAERFYVSPYYISRFFKEATGFTFVEYVNSVRVKEAKKLLEGSSLKASLIARKVGFGSVTHFGRVFKDVTGFVPLYYRRDK